MTCNNCPATLGPRNRSGYCRNCFSKCVPVSAEARARQSASTKRRLQSDPELMAKYRENARRASRSPAAVKARTERWHRERVWEQGNQVARAAEVRAKAAVTCRNTRLSWCPPHLRQSYLDLIFVKRFKADEARVMILEQDAREVARLRQAMGVHDQDAERTTAKIGRPAVWPDCPPDLLPVYLRLKRRVPAAEARRALEQRA